MVSPPANVPDELQPYVPRFEEILEFWGFKMATTYDPKALQLRLDYQGPPAPAAVTAYLILDNKPLLKASAAARPGLPWGWSTSPDKKQAVVKGLVDSAVNQFDNQLSEFTNENQIVKGPVQNKSLPSIEPAFTEYGTAFAIDSPNTYMTAYHVIARAKSITLYCGHDKSGPAVVESNDVGNDLAVLHSQIKSDAFLELAPNGSLSPGDHVFTIGFPVWNILGVDPKYTDGVVSALTGYGNSRSIMQITVPIQPGNSGGPLVDAGGRVVGIITSSAALPYFYRHTGTLPQNINYAVPSYYAYPLLESIQRSRPKDKKEETAVNRVTDSVCLVKVTTDR
jgi:S1-C subfamily serine protease